MPSAVGVAAGGPPYQRNDGFVICVMACAKSVMTRLPIWQSTSVMWQGRMQPPVPPSGWSRRLLATNGPLLGRDGLPLEFLARGLHLRLR